MNNLAKIISDHRKLFEPCLMCGRAVCECETEDDINFMWEVSEDGN